MRSLVHSRFGNGPVNSGASKAVRGELLCGRTNEPLSRVRALATWLVIFPSVALGQWLMSGLPESVPLILRAFVLTLVVVPVAVYVAVPFATKTLTRILPSPQQVSTP